MIKETFDLFIGYDVDGNICQYCIYRYITWFGLFKTVKIVNAIEYGNSVKTFQVIQNLK